MNTQYLIEDVTLTNIAEAIRGKTNEVEAIRTVDFASKIASIDLSAEEYMALVDLGLEYGTKTTLPTYSEYEINKVNNYIKYYGGELNG